MLTYLSNICRCQQNKYQRAKYTNSMPSCGNVHHCGYMCVCTLAGQVDPAAPLFTIYCDQVCCVCKSSVTDPASDG